MRIAVWYNLPSGGGKRALYDQVKGLVDRGHHVEFWCPPSANRDFMPLEDIARGHIVGLHWEGHSGRPPLTRLVDKLFPEREFSALAAHGRECADQIMKGGFDLLLAHSCMFMGTPTIGRFLNIPKALYLHEPYRSIYEATVSNPWAAMERPQTLSKWLRYPATRLRDILRIKYMRRHVLEECINARAYDCILVNSYFSRESVLRAYGVSAKVCYLGIDTQRFRLCKTQKSEDIITVGGLTRSKRLGFVVEAVGHLPEPRPRLICVANIIEPCYHSEVRKLAEEKGVALEIKQRISDSELVELLGRARVLAYAPRLEPFGYAILEANACGTPVVAVAEGGVRETVRDGQNGLLVDDDPRQMAEALGHLLKDEAYATKLGEQGARMVSLDWSQTQAQDRLENILTYTVNNKP